MPLWAPGLRAARPEALAWRLSLGKKEAKGLDCQAAGCQRVPVPGGRQLPPTGRGLSLRTAGRRSFGSGTGMPTLTECSCRTARRSSRSSSGSAACTSTCARVRMCARRPMRSSTGLARTLTRARFPSSTWKRVGKSVGPGQPVVRHHRRRVRPHVIAAQPAFVAVQRPEFAVSAGLAPIFDSARRTWIAAYQASEAGLLPHTLWQSTNGQVGANRTNWSGCGFCDTSIYHGTLASLSDLGWHAPTSSLPLLEEEEMQIQNDKGTVPFPSRGASTGGSPSSATPVAKARARTGCEWLRTPVTRTASSISRS